MKIKILSVVLILVLILAGCSAANRPTAGQSWLLDSMVVNGETYDLNTTQPITLEFDTGKVVGGSSGCNTYFGELDLKSDGTIVPGVFGSTEMACDKGMEIEAAYLAALSRVDSYDNSEYEFTLTADNGQTQLVYQLLRTE